MIRTYSELAKLKTFEDRFRYLELDGKVGNDTFGFNRYLNQTFYNSPQWKAVRDFVIIRDNGCDLGVEGFDIFFRPLVHHINPIRIEDIEARSESILDPEYLITTTHQTHNAIHYGDEGLLAATLTERDKNDTCPWRKKL